MLSKLMSTASVMVTPKKDVALVASDEVLPHCPYHP